MILMIDEEKRRMSTLQESLEELGYKVTFIDNVDTAYEFVASHQNSISAIILDIMMPWGESFSSEETKNGLLTGYMLLKKFRENISNIIPIIVYTAVNDPLLFKSINKEPNCTVFHKPESLSKIVTELQRLKIYPELKE